MACFLQFLWLSKFQELIKKIDVPVVFTDYCEEACHLAANCIKTVTGSPLKLPVSFIFVRCCLVLQNNSFEVRIII